MDTITAFPQPPKSIAPAIPTTLAETTRALTVTATYRLSEEGRKASLLAGGDGRAVQQLTVQVPANRLHLVSVDAEGVARLKLRPRYELDGQQLVVRLDAQPTYDVPPDIEALFREAARNHQLERSYYAERHAARMRRRETDLSRRASLAQAFFSDPTQRALVHPAPTPKRCYMSTEHGRVLFDTNFDEVPARDVPPEAHRRFRVDLRSQRDRNQLERAAQLALHEDKKRVIAEWIAAHGSREQQDRQVAGVLPIEDAIEAMTDKAFAPLTDRAPYVHDGVVRLQAHVRQCSQYADTVVTRDDLLVTSANTERMTAAQWALVKEFKVLMPDATITLRVHKLGWKHDTKISVPQVFGVLVTQRVGPFTLRREYRAPETS